MIQADHARSPPDGVRRAGEQAGICPRCGSRVVSGEPSPEAPARSPIAIHRASRRGTGLLALLLLCALSALPAAIALALLAHDEWIVGFVLVGLALASVASLLSAVGREPDAPLGRQALAVGAQAHLRARMACIAVAAWFRAVRALVGARRRQQRLHTARRDRLATLGEAILRGDRAHAAQLKAETRKLGEEMHARDHEATAAISSAREQIERERTATRATATRG